jgi:hypothetical protein
MVAGIVLDQLLADRPIEQLARDFEGAVRLDWRAARLDRLQHVEHVAAGHFARLARAEARDQILVDNVVIGAPSPLFCLGMMLQVEGRQFPERFCLTLALFSVTGSSPLAARRRMSLARSRASASPSCGKVPIV